MHKSQNRQVEQPFSTSREKGYSDPCFAVSAILFGAAFMLTAPAVIAGPLASEQAGSTNNNASADPTSFPVRMSIALGKMSLLLGRLKWLFGQSAPRGGTAFPSMLATLP